MSVTIHIRLMSGVVIEFQARGRNGRVKYLTVEKRMKEAVLDELKLDEDEYRVKFIHEDDEEKRQEMTERRYGGARYQLSLEAQLRLNSDLKKQRTYQDGETVHALVEEFSLRKAWENLKDEDEDLEQDE